MDDRPSRFRLVTDITMNNPLDNLKRYDIVLASASPRRRELLGMLDIPFTIAPGIDVDESYPPYLTAERIPEYLARKKSEAYSPSLPAGTLCITADTIVLLGEEVLGKPADETDARRMLRRLSGRTQRVITGVAVAAIGENGTSVRTESFSAASEVEFSELTYEEIDYYVERYKPLDKAGAYGIQEWVGAAAISGICGSFYNVMGLPLHRLYSLLRTF